LQQPSRGLMARHGPRLAGAKRPWPGTWEPFFSCSPLASPDSLHPGQYRIPRRGLRSKSRIWPTQRVTDGGSYHQRANYRPLTTSHMPLFPRFPGRGRLARPRSGAHAGRETWVLLSPTRGGWNVGEGFKPSPTTREPKVGHGAFTGYKLQAPCLPPPPEEVGRMQRHKNGFSQATNYRLLAAFQTPTPALPEGEGDLSDASRRRGRPVAVTTHHVPIGRTHGSAPTKR